MPLDENLVREVEADAEGRIGNAPDPLRRGVPAQRFPRQDVQNGHHPVSGAVRIGVRPPVLDLGIELHRVDASRHLDPAQELRVVWIGSRVVNADSLEADRRVHEREVLVAHGQVSADEVEVRGVRGLF